MTPPDFWSERVRAAASRWPTPFYLAAWEPVEAAIDELAQIKTESPIRHWLSVKTQPLKPLLKRWAGQGWGAEVVSEYELRAALAEGFPAEKILVNGVSKHVWLGRHLIAGLNVHFDSLTEARALCGPARDLAWHIGLRLHVDEEFNPDEPAVGTQFGMTAEEAKAALDLFAAARTTVSGLHFHLRSNVESPESYARALTEGASFCKAVGWQPKYVDTGGGLPDPSVGPAVTPEYLSAFGRAIDRFIRDVDGIDEIWMEHGRFVTGRSAVLVLKVCDLKERPEGRYLICDGGRTNHALVSDWEPHPVAVVPQRSRELVPTTVAGPTCMAFDRLARLPLPADVQVGDLIVWASAGAYHIPWETRFSRGLCRVIWCPRDVELQLVREEEGFEDWWGRWI